MIKFKVISIKDYKTKTINDVWIINTEQRTIEIKNLFFLFSKIWCITNRISGPGINVRTNDDIRNNNI